MIVKYFRIFFGVCSFTFENNNHKKGNKHLSRKKRIRIRLRNFKDRGYHYEDKINSAEDTFEPINSKDSAKT